MKYRILIALTALAAVTFSGCKKEGVYEPEARISYRFDEEYTQWLAWLNGSLDTTRQDIRRHLAEAYRWNGDLLTAIAFYDTTRHTDALEYSLTFTYEKKQVQKAVDAMLYLAWRTATLALSRPFWALINSTVFFLPTLNASEVYS